MHQADLIREYIELNPHRPGVADARLVRYGVPVWALIGYYRAIHGDKAIVARDYSIPAESVDAALAYYEEHKAEIDARLSENAA